MRFRTICLMLLTSLGLTPAQAQDLLACVDPDVKETLLFQGFDGGRQISRSLPGSFKELATPDGFDLVGSSVEDDVRLSGMLEITPLEGSGFLASFRATKLN